MGLFRRGKAESAQVEADELLDQTGSELGGELGGDLGGEGDAPGAGAGATDGTSGPFDRSAVQDTSDYLELGAIWLRGQPGMELRLEVNEQEQQITGVTAVLGESAVQLQAFAAPRTEGVWIEIRNEIAKSITEAGGTAEVVTGEFGEELQTRMPQNGPDGRTVFMPARFLGFDGPRWFLRAVVSGRAAIEPEAAAPIHEVIRTIVVDRGHEARPPRELLPLRLPESPAPDTAEESGSAEPEGEELKPFERGPEITEVR